MRLSSFDKRLRRFANLPGDVSLWLGEFRREPGKETDQIVSDENLPVATFTRANPDRRDLQRFGDLTRCLCRDDLQDDGKCARRLPPRGHRAAEPLLRLRSGL